MSVEEYMKYKEIDNDIRTNHEELMASDPFYGLVEVPIEGSKLSGLNILSGEGLYLAGGAVLYLMGVTNTYSDLDYFTTNKDTAEQILSEWEGGATLSSHAVTNKNQQIVTRVYTYPAQIVYGFDVGCCAVLYDTTTGRVYATQKALYCIKNMVNCIEVDRSSPTYIQRLCKYCARGFKILLPNIEGINWNVGAIVDIKVKLIRAIMAKDSGIDDQYPDVDVDVDDYKKNGGEVSSRRTFVPSTEFLHMVADETFLKYYLWDKNNNCFKVCGYNDEYRSMLPRDKASTLLLVASLGIGEFKKHIHGDYNQRPTGFDSIKDIKWNTIDPMKQLTGTFNPKSITDLREFYLTSPLVTTSDGVPIVSVPFNQHEFKNINITDE